MVLRGCVERNSQPHAGTSRRLVRHPSAAHRRGAVGGLAAQSLLAPRRHGVRHPPHHRPPAGQRSAAEDRRRPPGRDDAHQRPRSRQSRDAGGRQPRAGVVVRVVDGRARGAGHLQHRPRAVAGGRRHRRHRPRFRRADVGARLHLRLLHPARGSVRRGRRSRPRRGGGHRRVAHLADDQRARRRRHAVERAQRCHPARRQPHPQLVAGRGRHHHLVRRRHRRRAGRRARGNRRGHRGAGVGGGAAAASHGARGGTPRRQRHRPTSPCAPSRASNGPRCAKCGWPFAARWSSTTSRCTHRWPPAGHCHPTPDATGAPRSATPLNRARRLPRRSSAGAARPQRSRHATACRRHRRGAPTPRRRSRS